mgnify:FL=1
MRTGRRSHYGSNELKKASLLFRRNKFADVLRLLEPQTFRYRENEQFYYLLGVSCLYTGDFGGAYTYLRRAYQLNSEDINTLFALAAVHLKRQESNEALLNLLAILDIDSGNKKAKKALQLIRDHINSKTLEDFVQSDKISFLYPSTGFALPPIVPIIVLIIIIVPLVLLLFQKSDGIELPGKKPRSQEIAELKLEETKPVVSESGDYRYILTEKEINESFTKAKRYFQDYNDNAAQKEINRLLQSNASEQVKEKVRFLEGFLRTPTFTTLKTSYSYREVDTDKYLYDNCYVIWKGKISNLSVSEERIAFDFLVGYHDEKVLEGVVPVTLDFAVSLEQGHPIELLGRIHIENDRITLTGVSVHHLAP